MFEFIGGFRSAKHTLFPPAAQTPLDQACLISLCNTVPGQPHMLIAGADGTITPVTFPGRITGVTGIVIGADHLTVAIQSGGRSAIARLGPDFRTRKVTYPRGLSDTHGLVDAGYAIYAASTGTDGIVRLWPDLSRYEALHPFPTTGRDVHHINDICLHRGEIVFSMFGARRRHGLRNGAIMNLSDGSPYFDGLGDPHSVTSDGDNLYVLESPTGTLYRINDDGFEKVLSVQGYARGLCISPDRFIIGVSAPRAKSRLGPDRRKGRLLPDPALASPLARCGLYVCDRRTGLHSFIDLTAYGSEIYQVAVLPAHFATGGAE